MRYAILAFLLITSVAFADEAAKPSDFAQPRAAIPQSEKGAVSSPVKSAIEPVPIAQTAAPATSQPALPNEYKVGVDDILDINIIQPEQMALTATVSPDGSITFPYIGRVDVKGKTPAEIQEEIQRRLADG